MHGQYALTCPPPQRSAGRQSATSTTAATAARASCALLTLQLRAACCGLLRASQCGSPSRSVQSSAECLWTSLGEWQQRRRCGGTTAVRTAGKALLRQRRCMTGCDSRGRAHALGSCIGLFSMHVDCGVAKPGAHLETLCSKPLRPPGCSCAADNVSDVCMVLCFGLSWKWLQPS